MALLEWKDNMSVGEETLDSDHRKLLGMLNHLHDAVKAGRGPEVVEQALADLAAYAEYHFEVEERLLKLVRYPDLAAHREVHTQLVGKLEDKRRKLAAAKNRERFSYEVLDFLSDWLMRHILREDMRYRPWFTGKAAKGSASESGG